MTKSGKEAWDKLHEIAAETKAQGKPVKNRICLVLTDVEMPEMDGYMLTKMIKSDARFAGIPVLMHSSLSGASNQKLGESVGVDAYVSKFEPQKLSMKLREMLKITEK
jgi:two-component system chemotaxis response regulator CheV